MAEERIGTITHYFGNLGVAVVSIESGTLSIGDTIHVMGHTSDFTQTVDSMQVEHDAIDSVKAGQEVALKVVEHARKHDQVFKVAPD